MEVTDGRDPHCRTRDRAVAMLGLTHARANVVATSVPRPCDIPRRMTSCGTALERIAVMPTTLQAGKNARHRRIPLSTRRMVSLPASQFYGDTLRTLTDSEVPFVVGGAFTLKHYAGIDRATKDLDIFLRRRDLPRALEALREKGYVTDDTFPHWLAKAWCGDHFVDFIHASANGLCRVDDQW